METIWQFITHENVAAVLRAGIKILAGLFLARFAAPALVRLFKQTNAHQVMLIRRVSTYLIVGIFSASALVELGFEIGVLLGAAGILTVALGFASQTSASNIISGLFLLGEKPFEVGDIIKIGDTTGEVLGIDLLSVKLRTFDNLFVRIPNEQLIKSEMTNLRRFPIRRYDLALGVAYKSDLRRVQEILMEVASNNPLCLEEPAPLIIFLGFGDSSIDYQFSVWANRDRFLDLRNSISREIKEAFDAHEIEIPFPHRTLYTGSVTEAMPLRIVGDNNDGGSEGS